MIEQKIFSHSRDTAPKVVLVWELPNFQKIVESIDLGAYVSTKTFSLKRKTDSHWKLSMIPRPRGAARDYVSFYLHPLDDDQQIRARFKLCIIDRNQKMIPNDVRLNFRKFNEPCTNRWYGDDKFILRSDLFSKDSSLLQWNGGLKVLCFLRIDASAYKTQPRHDNLHLSDCRLIHRGKSYPGHRSILATSCPMFALWFKAKKQDDFKVNNKINPDVLEQLLWYVYTGTITRPELSAPLLVLAKRFLMDELAKKCMIWLVKNLNEQNSRKFVRLAKQLKINRLYRKAEKVIKRENEEENEIEWSVKETAMRKPVRVGSL